MRFQRCTRQGISICLLLLIAPAYNYAGERTLEPRLRHFRIDGPREWDEFPKQSEAAFLELAFDARKNDSEQSLRLRQQDVKQQWNITLNGQSLGRLVRDENDMVVYWDVPVGALRDGKNVLRIEQQTGRNAVPDDVRVGEVLLYDRPKAEILSASQIEVEVVDEATGKPTPSRITIVNSEGALQTPGNTSNDDLAVRPGIVYTSTGKAKVGLPAGKYMIYAGRGFEYSLDSAEIDVQEGKSKKLTLRIRREVPTDGYVACDTHVHTLTHSGHGDSSVEERMITLAGEGLELPIATDHNVHIDHIPFAKEMNVRSYFTPVIGNEVTTKVGHFNIFPVRSGAAIPDYRLTEWSAILDGIYRTPNVKVAILNHARDLHSGVRPFGPKQFNSAIGENIQGWSMTFNAMEVVNSAAIQSDPLQLFHDWMALLNRGYYVTPVGSSDSHDVGRHFVGQGRTYIRCNDRDPAQIDVDEAVDNFLAGRVMVSYGLLAEMTVEGEFRSGDLARAPHDEVTVGVRVLGPHWVEATEISLYANGQRIRHVAITESEEQQSGLTVKPDDSLGRGVKWHGEWKIPRPKHDVHLVAIATGPGVDGLYWKTARPYQPTSSHWEPRVIGCSGAVWLDADRDGRKTSAYKYAKEIFTESQGDLRALVEKLAEYDEAVAAQAAHRYHTKVGSLLDRETRPIWNDALPHVLDGFRNYLAAWRETERARVSP